MTPFGLLAATGAVVALLWLRRHHAALGLTENGFWASIWMMLLAAVAGSKGLFVLLGWPHYARGDLHFWADFNTGFVFFGGLIGATAAGAIIAWTRGLSFLRGADYFVVALPLGHAIGRLGCYAQGCCPGRPPHPVQLYESAGLLLIAGACRMMLLRVEHHRSPCGAAFALYLVLYGGLRLLLDPLRLDGRPERFAGLSHQQLVALAVLTAGTLIWLRVSAARRSATSHSPCAAP
jgi:phosphatidylglycerol---prolipoprotein diacylglyceryl transferase